MGNLCVLTLELSGTEPLAFTLAHALHRRLRLPVRASARMKSSYWLRSLGRRRCGCGVTASLAMALFKLAADGKTNKFKPHSNDFQPIIISLKIFGEFKHIKVILPLHFTSIPMTGRKNHTASSSGTASGPGWRPSGCMPQVMRKTGQQL